MRLPEPYTFFVDRSLGRDVVVKALRAAGESAVAHDDNFDQDASDTEWLEAVGQRRWVVLTKDARILTNALERNALLDARVAAFMLGRGDVNGGQMAIAFVTALPAMKKVLRRVSVPLIATVSVDGLISTLYEGGERLTRPRRVKP